MKEQGSHTWDKTLTDPKTPYTVTVDRIKLIQLTQDVGIPDEPVKKLNIVLERCSSLDKDTSVIGEYEIPVGKDDPEWINLAIGHEWQRYTKASSIAEKIADKKMVPNKNQFKGILFTKRLSKYLATAPRERALAFADKLLKKAMTRSLNSTLMHELKHMSNFHRGKHKMWFNPSVSKLSRDTSVLRLLDIEERNAETFGRKNLNNPKWRDIITIEPKPQNQSPK